VPDEDRPLVFYAGAAIGAESDVRDPLAIDEEELVEFIASDFLLRRRAAHLAA
jgi:hypothetical protein